MPIFTSCPGPFPAGVVDFMAWVCAVGVPGGDYGQTLSFLALFPQVSVDFLAWNPAGMGQVVFSLYNSETFRKINQPKENKICHSGGKSVPPGYTEMPLNQKSGRPDS